MYGTKGFARAACNLFRKYWCNFPGQQRVIIGESSRGKDRGDEGGKVKDRMKKEIDVEQGKRREKVGRREGNGERRRRGGREGGKSVM